MNVCDMNVCDVYGSGLSRYGMFICDISGF